MDMFFIVFLLCIKLLTASTEIVWMLDDSYSIARYNYINAKKLILDVNNVILSDERYANTTSFGLLEFGSRITGAEPITQDYDKFVDQMTGNRFGSAGKTRMSNAFEYLNKHLLAHNKTVDRRVAAIITDGAPNPGPIYGGEALVKAINTTFEENGLDKLIYIMVENSIGQRKANPNQFVKVSAYYNKSEDFISFNFKHELDEDDVYDVFCLLLNCNNETITMSPTMSPTNNPTMAPTNSPSMAPTMSPTNSPSMSPTNNPTMVPTPLPTPSPTKFTLPPGFTFPPHTHAPHSHPHDHDFGMSAGALAGIILAVIALVFAMVAFAYTLGNDNN